MWDPSGQWGDCEAEGMKFHCSIERPIMQRIQRKTLVKGKKTKDCSERLPNGR